MTRPGDRVAVTLLRAIDLEGLDCGGHDCSAPATHLLEVTGSVEACSERTYYPTCITCVTRVFERAGAHLRGRA